MITNFLVISFIMSLATNLVSADTSISNSKWNDPSYVAPNLPFKQMKTRELRGNLNGVPIHLPTNYFRGSSLSPEKLIIFSPKVLEALVPCNQSTNSGIVRSTIEWFRNLLGLSSVTSVTSATSVDENLQCSPEMKLIKKFNLSQSDLAVTPENYEDLKMKTNSDSSSDSDVSIKTDLFKSNQLFPIIFWGLVTIGIHCGIHWIRLTHFES